MSVEVRKDGKWTLHPQYVNVHLSRDYAMFGVLSGVRNRVSCEPVAHLGVPADASDGYRKLVEEYGDDGHTHSYLTGEEVSNCPWDKAESVIEGYGTLRQYLDNQSGKYLTTYLSESNRWMVGKEISIEQAERYINASIMDNSELYEKMFLKYSCKITYGSYCQEFLEFVKSVSNLAEPEDIRFVFFYDN